jgi:hypothetical protein
MRIEIHTDRLNELFPFSRIPEGPHQVPATAYPDEREAFDFEWPAEMRDGTLYFYAGGFAADEDRFQPLEQWWRK